MIKKNFVREGVVSGTAKGAAIGGLAGSVIPVVGTAIGAAAGGALGGLGGLVSDDEEEVVRRRKFRKQRNLKLRSRKDYDNDGKVETGKEEYFGSKMAAAAKSKRTVKEGVVSGTAKGAVIGGLAGSVVPVVGTAIGAAAGGALGGLGGLVSDDEEEVVRKRKNTAKRRFKSVKKTKSVKESNLYHFINQITQKNYSTADKYLQREIDRRIKAKISNLL